MLAERSLWNWMHKWVHRLQSSHRAELKADLGCIRKRDAVTLERWWHRKYQTQQGKMVMGKLHYALWYDFIQAQGTAGVKIARQYHSSEVSNKGHLQKHHPMSPSATWKIRRWKPLRFLSLIMKIFPKKLHEQASWLFTWVFFLFLVSEVCLSLWGRNWVA